MQASIEKSKHKVLDSDLFRTLGSLGLLICVYLATQIWTIGTKKGWTIQGWLNSHLGWDAGWYEGIASRGYDLEQAFAFFPLWPGIVRLASEITHVTQTQIVGVALSAIFFLVSVYLLSPLNRAKPLSPYTSAQSTIALLPLVLAPGAWVFITNHTESLFLLLTVASLQSAFRDKILLASVFAGLAALTRNQGIFFAASIGLYFLLDKNSNITNRLKRFTLSGVISGALFCLWPLYQYVQTGSFFTSVSIQEKWGHVLSFSEYLEAMFSIGARDPERELLFWGLIFSGLYFALKDKNKQQAIPVAFYMISTTLLWPYQGDGFQNAFRYSIVLFPFWLFIGKGVQSLFSSKLMWQKAFGIVVVWAFLEKILWISSRYYSHNVWPY